MEKLRTLVNFSHLRLVKIFMPAERHPKTSHQSALNSKTLHLAQLPSEAGQPVHGAPRFGGGKGFKGGGMGGLADQKLDFE